MILGGRWAGLPRTRKLARSRRPLTRGAVLVAMLALVLVGLGLVGLGLHLVQQPPAAEAANLGTTSAVGQVVVRQPVRNPAAPDPASRAPVAPAAFMPRQLALPRQHTQASVLPVGVGPSRGLDLPADPGTVGWWAGGAAPGQSAGSAVLAGHIDAAGYGPGALTALLHVSVGDPVVVSDSARRALRYRVTARLSYPKSALPASVFRSDGPPTLTLVTCGGPFDSNSHHYRDNIVVFAVPTTG